MTVLLPRNLFLSKINTSKKLNRSATNIGYIFPLSFFI